MRILDEMGNFVRNLRKNDSISGSAVYDENGVYIGELEDTGLGMAGGCLLILGIILLAVTFVADLFVYIMPFVMPLGVIGYLIRDDDAPVILVIVWILSAIFVQAAGLYLNEYKMWYFKDNLHLAEIVIKIYIFGSLIPLVTSPLWLLLFKLDTGGKKFTYIFALVGIVIIVLVWLMMPYITPHIAAQDGYLKSLMRN